MKDVTVIHPKDKEEWLKYRKQFIGGSEIAAILGLNEYMSPYDVWLNKTDRQEPFADNKHTLAGKFLEDGVAKYWEHETEHKIIKSSADDILYINNKHRIGGTPDRRFFWNGSHKEKAILEVKTTMKIIDIADIPMSWFVQPITYCGLLGYKKFVIVYFEFFTKELKWQEFDFDKGLYDNLCQAADDFWNQYVIPDTPPPAQTEADIKKLFPNHEEGKSLIATDELLDTYSKMIALSRELRGKKKEYSDLATQIKLIMKDAETLFTPQMEKIFTFKSGSRGRTLRIYEV